MALENLMTALIGFFGLSFGIFQWNVRKRLEHSQARFKLLSHFYSHGNLHEIFQIIDYGRSFLGGDFAHSNMERDLDQLLLFFDHVERCRLAGVLNPEGFSSFEYFFNRLRDHNEVISYLKFHQGIILNATDTKISPFSALLNKFAEEINKAEYVNVFNGEKRAS